MSGSRKSLLKAAQTFNPRAENSWSKDDSKFGQKMLEKMGWKKGEGIGRFGQGTPDNIKIRLKIDKKGLGFKQKEDEWVAVEHSFSELLSDLNKASSRTKTTKVSLESTSSSSRSRMHYRRFIRGKDISKYSRKDLSGILGIKEANDDCDDTISESMDDSSVEHTKFSSSSNNQLAFKNNCEKKLIIDLVSRNDTQTSEVDETYALESEESSLPFTERRTKKLKTKDHNKTSEKDSLDIKLQPNSETSVQWFDTGKFVNISLEIDDSHKKKKEKKKKTNYNFTLHVDNNCEKEDDDLDLENGTENSNSNEVVTLELGDSELPVQNESEKKSNIKNSKKGKKNIESNLTSLETDDTGDSVDTLLTIENCYTKEKAKKRKKCCLDLNQSVSEREEKFETDVQCDTEIDSSIPKKKRKKKSVVDLNSNSVFNVDNEDDMKQSLQVKQENVFSKKGSKKRTVNKLDVDPVISLDEDVKSHSNVILCFDDECEKSASLIEELEKNHSFKRSKKLKSLRFDEKEHTEVKDECSEEKPERNELIERKKNAVKHESETSEPVRKTGKRSLDLDDFTTFMKKGTEFYESTNLNDVIQKFEENKETLLKRYRETYLRKYLESANENDACIYSNLNGDELDLENTVSESVDIEGNKIVNTKKLKPFVPGRRLSKAENIVLKARLLKAIQNKTVNHNFTGSNLNCISGYGNEIVPS